MRELDNSVRDMQCEIQHDLETIVKRFNTEFQTWEEGFGCKANLGWKYDETGRKHLSILNINMPIVEEAVSESRIKEAESIFANTPDINF